MPSGLTRDLRFDTFRSPNPDAVPPWAAMQSKPTYRVGDAVPFGAVSQLVGAELDHPVWHALITPPQCEARSRDKLEAEGVQVSYPTEERTRHHRGKRIVTTVPSVPRLVYAKFDRAPRWHVMRARRVAVAVICRNGWPVAIRPSDVHRAMTMPEVARELAEEAIRLATLRPGDMATITSGPLLGFAVEILATRSGRALWRVAASGMRGESDIQSLQKGTQLDVA